MPIGSITQTMSAISPPPHRGVDVQTVFVNKQEDFQDHLADITIDELNTLKDQLNTRIGEINSTATTMNGYATSASTSASTATTKAGEASTSASTATTKAGEASTSASGALTSKNQASTFATNSSNNANKASQWADNNYNVEVEAGRYSAKHWSTVAETVVVDTVKLTGNQTIAGVKTFSSSPVVPTPTTNTQAANKAYVDNLITIPTIAIGTATFTATTNNINLTGIGIGAEIGDVIQISGAEDAKNNSEFTVEVITDANNIIVNQAHANKGTAKNLAARASDTGVTVKLLAKWYNAPIGLGQDWVNVTSSRVSGNVYLNTTGRQICAAAASGGSTVGQYYGIIFTIRGVTIPSTNINVTGTAAQAIAAGFVVVPRSSSYAMTKTGNGNFDIAELR